MANPSLFYCLRFVFRTFLLNFQGCHCSIIKVHLFVCTVRCLRRLCYFSTSLCACQVLFKLFFEALSNFLSRTRPCCFVSFAATLIFYQSFFGLSSTFFIFFDSVPGSSGWFPDCLYLSGSVVSAFPPQQLVWYHCCADLSTVFFKIFKVFS